MMRDFGHERLPLAVLMLVFALSALAWFSLPAVVPVHWGLTGPPDAYGSPYPVLLIVPVVAMIMYTLLRVLPAMDSERTQDPAFQVRFARIRAWTLVLMLAIHVVMVLSMAGRVTDPLAASAIAMGVWLALFGPMLAGIPRNWIVGIRTPITLGSDDAWRSGQRLGARVFMIAGTAIALAGLTGSRVAMLVALAGLVFGALYAGTYGARAGRGVPPSGGS